MTVDVEDYFQVSAFEEHVDRGTWRDIPCRVEANTCRILELFAERDHAARHRAHLKRSMVRLQHQRRGGAQGHEIVE